MAPNGARHSSPTDSHLKHAWFQEAKTSGGSRGVLNDDGLNNIANHKYVGGAYTHLDNFLSPNFWGPLTEMLPMWMAPNLVTTIGGCFNLFSFMLSTWYLVGSGSSDVIPRWLYFCNAACMFIYHTCDCMDGKQARRTGSSSPLGQLFDHGMDCISNMCHLQCCQSVVMLPPRLVVMMQCSLQLAFWQAQWEEYYTGILPHATGGYCGITEVLYGTILWLSITGLFGRDVYDFVILKSEVFADSESFQSIWAWFIADDKESDLQLRHVLLVLWFTMVICLMALSALRVYNHVRDLRVFASALSKFASPVLLCVVAIAAGGDTYNATSVGEKSLATSVWVALGLAFSLVTIKIIVFSMARMSYASVQVDVLPFVLVVGWMHWVEPPQGMEPSKILAALDFFYLLRLGWWVHEAIRQLCSHLDIFLFRIKAKKSA